MRHCCRSAFYLCTQVRRKKIWFLLKFTTVPSYIVLSSHRMCHSLIGVVIFSILNCVLKFSGKSKVYFYIWLNWLQIRPRSAGPGCLFRSGRIRQNDADPIWPDSAPNPQHWTIYNVDRGCETVSFGFNKITAVVTVSALLHRMRIFMHTLRVVSPFLNCLGPYAPLIHWRR